MTQTATREPVNRNFKPLWRPPIGGEAGQRIMDIVPSKLHERVAVFLGSKAEVERVTAYHRDAG